MTVKFSTRAMATALLCAGLAGCASRPPRSGTSFDLYYEAAELFPLAYECIYEQREKEIERLKDRFGAVKEWLSARAGKGRGARGADSGCRRKRGAGGLRLRVEPPVSRAPQDQVPARRA